MSRVQGIYRLIESFSAKDVPMGEDFDLPKMDDPATTAELILNESVKCTENFQGRSQGWSGHLLTSRFPETPNNTEICSSVTHQDTHTSSMG